MTMACFALCRISSTHMSGLLRDRLHWLRIPEQVKYRLCLLALKAVHGTAPHYLRELCRSNAEVSARFRLRSAEHGNLQVPCSKTNFGDRAFSVTGPASWNRLPATIRSFSDGLFFRSHSARTRTPLTWTPCYGI